MTILGLDLGTNSIGWALIETDGDKNPKKIIGMGSRIFQEAVEGTKRTPKNKHRREKRGMRRSLRRRRERREALRYLLIGKNMLPDNESERVSLLTDDGQYNPYLLRKRGLDEKLSPHEFGRVLFHINKRRGFFSNRKAELAEILRTADLPNIRRFIEEEERQKLEKTEHAQKTGKTSVKSQLPKEAEESAFQTDIANTRKKIHEAGARTLGEYLYAQTKKRAVIRADREMYEAEFNALWSAQAVYYSDLLTPPFKAKVHQIIFSQRPLRTQKFLVGNCFFEKNRKRASRATLEAQRARLLQDVNNMEIVNTHTGESIPLRQGQREMLIAALSQNTSRHFGANQDKDIANALNQKGVMPWGKVKKLLGIDADQEINLERGDRKNLIGDRTELNLREILGSRWKSFDVKQKEDLLTDLLTIDRKDAMIKRFLNHWKFTDEEAYRLAIADLEPGYSNLSLKALRRVLPYLEKGLKWHEALDASGYKISSDNEKQSGTERLGLPPDLRNPVVMKALYETRKLVNSVIARWGKPSLIRVELAREVKISGKRLSDLMKKETRYKKANEEAEKEIMRWAHEHSEYCVPKRPKGHDKLKYRIWKEQGERCLYTGKTISPAMLFNGEAEVDHILPLSLSLDDSYLNKALCLAAANAQKGQRTPKEWLEKSNADQWQSVLSRSKKLPFIKRVKIETEKVDTDEFVSRQLVDTQYIARAAKDYLAGLGVSIETTKGPLTARLREMWDLNRHLSQDRSIEKTREDHRHHAVDALVVALTDRGVMQKLSGCYEVYEKSRRWNGTGLKDPYPDFRTEIMEKLDSLIVSHSPKRKIHDALMKDTAYGYIKKENAYVSRVPLHKLKPEIIRREIGKDRSVIDFELHKILNAWLDAGNSLEKAEENPPLHKDGKTPVRKVRLMEKKSSDSLAHICHPNGEPYKYYALDNNHHVEIYEHRKSKKRKGFFVSMLEAARRARPKKGQPRDPVFQRGHYGDDYDFIMSLCVNDMVEVEEEQKKYYRIQKLTSSGSRITLRLHTASTLQNKDEEQTVSVNQFRGRKIAVDALGFIFYPHD